MTTPTGPMPFIAAAATATPTAPATSSITAAVATRRTSGLMLAVLSALAFSSSGPLVKPLLEGGWSLGAALLVRIATAALVLSPFLVRAMRRERRFVRRHGTSLVMFGLMPVAGCQLFYFSAMQRMPVAVALLIQYLAPVLLVVWVWARTRRRPSAVVLVGSVVAMAGLVLVVDVAGARFDLVGVIFALGAAICTCIYFVMSERTDDSLPPLALAAGGMVVATAVIALLLITGILPFSAPAVVADVVGLALPGWLVVLWVGIVTSLGYAFGVAAVPRTGARLASFVGLSEVLFALGFAWLLLSEAPAGVQFVGGALLLAGVVLVRLDPGSAAGSSTGSAQLSLGADPLPAGGAPGAGSPRPS